MLKNYAVLIVPGFENHQSESTYCNLVTTHIRPKHFCFQDFILSKTTCHETMHFSIFHHFQEFIATFSRENHSLCHRGNRLIQIASLARSDLERYKRVERKSLGPATKIIGGFWQWWIFLLIFLSQKKLREKNRQTDGSDMTDDSWGFSFPRKKRHKKTNKEYKDERKKPDNFVCKRNFDKKN